MLPESALREVAGEEPTDARQAILLFLWLQLKLLIGGVTFDGEAAEGEALFLLLRKHGLSGHGQYTRRTWKGGRYLATFVLIAARSATATTATPMGTDCSRHHLEGATRR